MTRVVRSYAELQSESKARLVQLVSSNDYIYEEDIVDSSIFVDASTHHREKNHYVSIKLTVFVEFPVESRFDRIRFLSSRDGPDEIINAELATRRINKSQTGTARSNRER